MKEEKNNNDIILRLRNITKLYPGTIALRKINMDVKRGKVHGIIGKNGAGKTTLVNIICGIIASTEGDIFIRNKRFKVLSHIEARKEGISIVSQKSQLIPDFTVKENLFIPNFIYSWGKIIDWKRISLKAKEILNKAGTDINPEAKVSDLSIGEKQFLSIIKSYYVEDAQIIILDEASTAFSERDEEILYKLVQASKREGKTTIFITHQMKKVLKFCDEVTILRDGRLIRTEKCSGLNVEKLSSLIVKKSSGYKFEKLKTFSQSTKEKSKETVLSVEGLTKVGVFYNVNFELKRGEIVGLVGLRGSGRTEIFKAIVGANPADEGKVRVGKGRKWFTSVSQALRNGVVYLPEDRDEEGIIEVLSVMKNITLLSLHRLRKGLLISRKKEEKLATNLIETLNIKVSSLEQEVKYLSGGNKQKVVIGKILAPNPVVLLLDEPTKGIDIETKVAILKKIKELSKKIGIIVTSPELEDIMLICDRILVLYERRIITEVPREKFDVESLYLNMQGHSINNGKMIAGDKNKEGGI